MSPDSRHDVLIAGAGPAGTQTALRLANLGWRVALLDSRSFPRKKPCGEFLSPACLPFLEELGLLDGLWSSGAVKVTGMDIVGARARTRGDYRAVGPFHASHGCGIGIRREVLDTRAVEAAENHANITVLQGWRVSNPIQSVTGRVIGLAVIDPTGERRTLRSRFVVGADGLGSRVARGLGWTKPLRGPERFAIVARFEGVAPRQQAELHLLGRDYIAACPIDGDLFTANLVVDAKQLPKGSASLESFFRESVKQSPSFAERLAGSRLAEPLATCGPLRAERRRITGPGAALVGDACGFVDPLTGEGVFFAMQGASMLARAVHEALCNPESELAALNAYERARKREFAPRYALARLLQHGLRRPAISERVVEILARVPALSDLMLGLTGDYLPPSGLLLPSVWKSLAFRERLAAS